MNLPQQNTRSIKNQNNTKSFQQFRGFNGDGQLAIHAQLNYLRGLFVSDEEEIFFCDAGNHRVRIIDRFGMISTVVGSGKQGYNGDDILATHAHNGIIKTIAGTGRNGDGILATGAPIDLASVLW